jgi:CheY-like chemotaxis protein
MSDPARVVVAHDESAIRDAAVEVARGAGYEVIGVTDGESARILLSSQPTPAVMVVDVALPGVLGYELVESAAALGLGTKIIFIASVYSKTAYKRRPSNLYGAHDYVEQHHIVDQLRDKLEAAIVSSTRSVRRRKVSETGQLKAVQIQKAGEARLTFRYRTPEEATERAHRLARLIVADVVLYCGDEVEKWVAAGAADADMPERLRTDMDEGRRVFALRVPEEVAAQRDFITEALHEVAESVHREVREAT